jgi:hypothetical protein
MWSDVFVKSFPQLKFNLPTGTFSQKMADVNVAIA